MGPLHHAGRPSVRYAASNPDRSDTGSANRAGEIYKLELDGTIVGTIGRGDNPAGVFRTVHAMDCRHDNEIIAAGPNSVEIIRLLQ